MADGVDVGGVTRWFATAVERATPPFTFSRVAGGHSCVTLVVTDAEGERFVLRRPPIGKALATAHDVVREHTIISALAPTAVPVPEALGVCTDGDVSGAPFYVMAFTPGVVLHGWHEATTLLATDDDRRRAAESLVDALVALHGVDVEDVGLGSLARPKGYLERQLSRWSRQWEASRTRELPGMERLHGWLVAQQPAESGKGIVHGDFRLGNLIHRPDGTVAAVLDWELCSLGPPLADVSYLLASWAEASDDPSTTPTAASAAPGFPSRAELRDRYAAATGTDVGELAYWSAFNAWRSAAICEGVYRRYLDGDMGVLPDDVDKYRVMVEAGCERGLRTAGIA
jgi:aminoglycoside phosphotransferase (APT) family kinase protein